MLFIIKNCRPELYKDDKKRLLAISNLLKSHGERKNIVIAEKPTLESIIASEIYGTLDKNYAEDILLNIREIGNLSSILDFHAIVDFEKDIINPFYQGNTKSIITGYNFFTDPEKICHPSFVAENETDYNFYKLIANFYQKHESKLNLGITFNFCLGAGSHCKPQFDRLKDEKKIVFCIVDSDKSHPNKAEGETSAAFKPTERGIQGISCVEVLQHREIESLIPIRVIEKIVIEKIKDKIDALDTIKIMSAIDHHSLKYFDLKEGMSIEEMISLDRAHGKFWIEILLKIQKFNTKSCVTSKTQKNCDNCASCPSINGISEYLLSYALESIEKESSHSIYKNIEPPIRSEWSRLGRLISSWGCHLNHGASRS